MADHDKQFPDGFKEGVMNDDTGVQFGVTTGETMINPADIPLSSTTRSPKKSKSDNRNDDKMEGDV